MKKLKKALLTAAALLAFNVHAQETPTPDSTIQYFDKNNWTGSVTNRYQIVGDETATALIDVSGEYINEGLLYGIGRYSLYSHSSSLDPITIHNYGVIGSDTGRGIGVALSGMSGKLYNYEHAQILGGMLGIMIDGTNSESSNTDFEIWNMGQIYSDNSTIYKWTPDRNLQVNNTATGSILSGQYAILSYGGTEVNNDGLIESLDQSAILLMNGGEVTNNGTIKSRQKNSISSMDRLTLSGSGTYEGFVQYIGDPNESNSKGVLNLRGGNMDFKAAELSNWGAIGTDGGIYHFNVQNDAQNQSNPRTMVLSTTNSVVYSGDGSWGDGDFYLIDSLLNPYENKQDFGNFWNNEATIYRDGNEVKLYDRKNYEKLIVNDLRMYNGGLVIDVRLSEPDYNPSNALYSEDDRAGYWEIYSGGDNDYNPDNSYGGLGYNHRYKRVHDGGPDDLYTFQRINHDKIDVRGTASVSDGSLYILDHTKWMDEDGYYAPEFAEDQTSLDHIELDILDGNIRFEDFGNVEFYSDYFGVDYVDSTTGKIHLTRDAYNSNVKGQVDWWLKQTSLGFEPDYDPQEAAALTSAVIAGAQASQATAPTAFATTMNAEPKLIATTMLLQAPPVTIPAANDDDNENDNDDETSPGVAALHAASMARRGVTVSSNDDDNENDNDDDSAPTPAPAPVQVVNAKKLPYETTQDYNINITDLAASLELKATIYSFGKWADVDTFLDELNKLEYASLMTSNINAISNRVKNIYTQLDNDYYRDANGVSIWFDTYMFDDSLQGKSNHSIDGSGFEVTAGFDKQFMDKLILGMSFNHTDYSSDVNDSGVRTVINSDGYGLTAFAEYEAGNLTQIAMIGFNQIRNTDVIADFDSSEMFAAYRAEYMVKTGITAFAGLRYATVKYDEIILDNNGIEGFTHDSLESELGVKLSKQFKKLKLNVTGAWMHEMFNPESTIKVHSIYGDFDQKGITRDVDSFRFSVGGSYQLTDKMSIGVEAAREFSANAENNSIAAKFRIAF